MTWDRYHRRRAALRAALELADSAPGLHTTPDLVARAGGAFDDETDFLLDVQLAWSRRLGARLDDLAGEGADDLGRAVVAAWRATAADMPGARALLDAHDDDPAMARAIANEHALLALAAGVPGHGAAALARGRALRDRAREGVPTTVSGDAERGGATAGLVGRLRRALAA